jgi:hypothetical protein
MVHRISKQQKVRLLYFIKYLENEATPQKYRLIDMQAFLDISVQKLACTEAFFN